MCQPPWTPSKQPGIFLICLRHQASGMHPPSPLYPPPPHIFSSPPIDTIRCALSLSSIHPCSASHYLYLKCRSILTHQKHMLATHTHTCVCVREAHTVQYVGACMHIHELSMHTNPLMFSLKADTQVHLKMGPRCTPEILGSRARAACCFIPRCRVTEVQAFFTGIPL